MIFQGLQPINLLKYIFCQIFRNFCYRECNSLRFFHDSKEFHSKGGFDKDFHSKGFDKGFDGKGFEGKGFEGKGFDKGFEKGITFEVPRHSLMRATIRCWS